ncbi:PrsW family intramembrane metalloprotease [Brevibacterium casei]|uniref:Membrane proteinase PrsW, cleaves anti-sigma factor RsiW, M82 family n=1 Tax=Brevibacterium casei CIP 102111 TaxID=1255625 RepID=A0A2H1J1W5_9MICO|nr:PrsW family intramembrane metalloprotease [Brevibacterium casei]MCT1551361.1 PrsW family glutamic-type intramembrane protease [Brevibacterium casei]MCT1560497.1 PrsW family glutamic-type intramembrane protease [Brevibacterium casei]MCT2208939.1 PrsW family glutamic-type intramembrane protease [Brevibacterium casei]QPR39407.1 PrsW family intramembrane metalloprotease [Brevibacterium casei]QPR43572.1 PrsW family intramembrane metalloprotease [Brevibacterium casei]
MSEHAGPPHGPGPNHGGQHPGPVVDPRRSDDRFRPRPQNPQRTAAPPPMRRQAPGPGPDLGLRIPPPGQMTRPGHQSHPGQPMQSRVYEQPRFAPTVTQEMRVRAQMQPPQHRVAETPWTGAVRRTPEPAEPGSPGNVVRLVLAILAVCALVFGLLVMAIFGGFSFGARLFGLIGLSAIPLIGIIAYVLWLDRWKPQPKLLLGLCLLWGAVASVVLTLFVSLVGEVALYFAGVGAVPDVFKTVVEAPVVEETTKTALLVVIVLLARRHFEGPLDGLVYGALIGAGFAFTENVLYLGAAWEESASGLWVTFVLRCLCSPLLHTAFSSWAGVTIGFAARKWPWWAVILMWLPGLFVGMCLHAIWNGSMTGLQLISPIAQIVGLIVLSFILTTCWVVAGLILRRSERLHTRNMLGDYANSGWLSHAEVDMLGTWKGRKQGKRWAKTFPGGKQEMRTMIRLAGQLATTRMRLLAGLGGPKERTIENYELREFAGARDRLLSASRGETRSA